jgi:hypothetical protein
MYITHKIAIATSITGSALIGIGSKLSNKDNNNSMKELGKSLIKIGIATGVGGLIAYFINKDKINTFQHNTNVSINKDTYTYVLEYKRQLLQNITNLMNDLEISFVISHGNLIEYERGTAIYHDDDLDIRFCVNDIDKWKNYCTDSSNIDNSKYNLFFDKRFSNINQQRINGIQATLIEFKNYNNINIYDKIEIHVDLVSNDIISSVWVEYDIDYKNLRRIKYLNVDTYAPSKDDTIKILTSEYGNNFMIPNKTYTCDISSLIM